MEKNSLSLCLSVNYCQERHCIKGVFGAPCILKGCCHKAHGFSHGERRSPTHCALKGRGQLCFLSPFQHPFRVLFSRSPCPRAETRGFAPSPFQGLRLQGFPGENPLRACYSQTTCLLYILKKPRRPRRARSFFLRGFAFLAFLAVQKCSEDKLFGYKKVLEFSNHTISRVHFGESAPRGRQMIAQVNALSVIG